MCSESQDPSGVSSQPPAQPPSEPQLPPSSKSYNVQAQTHQKSGFNWPVCGGITCAVLIILCVVIALIPLIWPMMLWNQAKDNPLASSNRQIELAFDEFQDMTQSQINELATHLTAQSLAKDPYGYAGQLVVVEGKVGSNEGNNVNAYVVASSFSDSGYSAYVLDEAVVLVDISGENQDVKYGTTIRGFGMVFVVRLEDVWDLPFVGVHQEPEYVNVEGGAEEVVFHISKGIEVVYDQDATKEEAPLF